MSNVSRYCPSSCRFFVQSLEGEWWCDRDNIELEDYDDNPVRSESCYALAQAEEVVKNPRAAGYTPCGVCTDLGWVISDVPSANYYPVSDPSARMGYCSKYATNLMTIKEPYRCKACMDASMNDTIDPIFTAEEDKTVPIVSRYCPTSCVEYAKAPGETTWKCKRYGVVLELDRLDNMIRPPVCYAAERARPTNGCLDCKDREFTKEVHIGHCKFFSLGTCLLHDMQVQVDNGTLVALDNLMSFDRRRTLLLIPMEGRVELKRRTKSGITIGVSITEQYPLTIEQLRIWPQAIEAVKVGRLGVRIRDLKNLDYSKFAANPFGQSVEPKAASKPAPPVEVARPVIDLVTVMPITLDLGDEEDVCIRLNAKDMDDES